MSNPDDYGPGKTITPEQAVQYLAEHYPKIIMMMIHRMKTDGVVLGTPDIDWLAALPPAHGLGIKLNEEGIHLFIMTPEMTLANKKPA